MANVNLKVVQTPACSLYTGMGSSDTSCRITPYPVDLDGVKLTISDFGSSPVFTVDPKISGFEEINGFTAIIDNGDNTATLTGLTRDLQSKYPYTGSGTGKLHGSSATVVFSDNPQIFGRLAGKDNDETITGQWTFSTFPITPATPLATNLVAGFTKLSVAAANPLIPLVVGDNDVRVPSANPTTLFAPLSSAVPSGAYFPYAGRTAPAGYLSANGSSQASASFTALFAVLYPSFAVTITIASPAVLTTTGSHGLVAGDQVSFTTTGGLPSGLAVATNYYVIATGLTATAFELALTPGGPAINTSGSQSGVHTVYWSNYGPYTGTNFNLPDTRGVTMIGFGGQSTTVLSFDPTMLSGNNVTVPDGDFPVQGQAVVYTAAGTPITGLTSTSTYYIIRNSSTSISFASTQANANAGTAISLSGSPVGNQVLTFTTIGRTILGKRFGEEFHGSSTTEMSSHIHPYNVAGGGGSSSGTIVQGAATTTTTGGTNATGGNSTHNNMQPSLTANFIIKT